MARSRLLGAPASSSGTATFSSAVMVGMRWNDWKTMPTLRPRKRASASSLRLLSAWPATTTEPLSGCSSPAMTINRVDFPEPEGPTIPIASPRPIFRPMSLSICTLAAPRPSVRLTPVNVIAGPAACAKPEVSFMRRFRGFSDLQVRGLALRRWGLEAQLWASKLRSYGLSIAAVQACMPFGVLSKDTGGFPLKMCARGLTWALAAVSIGVLGWALAVSLAGPTRAADDPVRIVVLGDSLSAGYNLSASAAFPARLERALAAKGHAVKVANAGVS